MDRLPQGLPRDWRRTVRYLKRDPLHGGPPASNVGYGPDSNPLHALGLPLPNFRGIHRDGLPCHVNYDTIYAHWLKAQENPQDFVGIRQGLDLSRSDMNRLKATRTVQLFASCQPLTVQPLPDGSNIYSAEVGSIEQDFQDAFTWYKRWLEFLHYERYDFPHLHRLSKLATTVQQWKVGQTLFPPAEGSAVNGLYPVPPPMQEWLWPLHFWNTWQIRRDLRGWPDRYQQRDTIISILNNCIQKEISLDRIIFASDWYEDRRYRLPAIMREADAQDIFAPVLRDLRTCVDGQRDFFQTRALRYWGFKRPWKKIWMIMDTESPSQAIDQKVRECQRFLDADVYGSQLLGVHPILLRQVREKTDGCVIAGAANCTSTWRQGETVVETWCGHITCFNCLRNYWSTHHIDLDDGDVANPAAVGDWPCVMCRRSPGRLRSKLEIAQTDLFGAAGDAAADENIIDLTIEPIPHEW